MCKQLIITIGRKLPMERVKLMARTKAVQFDDKAMRLEEVKMAMKETNDKRLYERYQCIFLFLSGESRIRIATILDRNIDTVGTYIRTYSSDGLKGLQLDHSPGRPTRLTSIQEQELYQTIANKIPVDVGFPANMNWTSGLVRQWVKKEYQVIYSDRGTRQLLYRLGFSYTKPTYTLAKADPKKQEAFKQEFEEIKKIASARN
jgi:transposase